MLCIQLVKSKCKEEGVIFSFCQQVLNSTSGLYTLPFVPVWLWFIWKYEISLAVYNSALEDMCQILRQFHVCHSLPAVALLKVAATQLGEPQTEL